MPPKKTKTSAKLMKLSDAKSETQSNYKKVKKALNKLHDDTISAGGASDTESKDSVESLEKEIEPEVEDVDEMNEEDADAEALDGEGMEIEDEDKNSESSSDDSSDGEKDVDEECIYTFTKKKRRELDAEDDVGDDCFFEEDDKVSKGIFVPDNERKTKKVLTKFERVRLIGERATQISLGAKPMVKGVKNMDPKDVARLELKLGVIPIKIIRTLPTGKKERWYVRELEIIS